MKSFKMKLTSSLCLILILSQSSLTMSADLPQNLRPGFDISFASPTPDPSPSEEDDSEDTEVALDRQQQEQVVMCFRNEKACETSLASCEGSVIEQPTSWAWKIVLFLGGALSGMIAKNNSK
jgi:hypothetical protein